MHPAYSWRHLPDKRSTDTNYCYIMLYIIVLYVMRLKNTNLNMPYNNYMYLANINIANKIAIFKRRR